MNHKDELSGADQRYKKFIFELLEKEKKGETINYEKESVNFWNRELKKVSSKKNGKT